MPNVAHASLTGAELHEPKGAASATLGTVYVSNGAGSGTWQSVGTSAFTGMVADFAAPVVPTGWLELDGSTISTSTYSALFAVMSISTSGTRSNGSPIISSISSTSTFKVGYYVFGTGISSGTTIISIDSATQITLSNNASSSGTSSFFVCPWLMNTGTVTLPDATTAGRFRRSRTSSTKVGDLQADQNKAHTHTGSTGSTTVNHTHTFSATTGTMNSNTSHTHTFGQQVRLFGSAGTGGALVTAQFNNTTDGSVSLNNTNIDHTHPVSGTTDGAGGAGTTHTHTISSDGGTEARPLSLVLMTCVKT